MKKLLFILSVFCFTAINGQPVASPNSVLKLIDGAMVIGTGGVLVTCENLHLDNQGYVNCYPNNVVREASTFRFSGDSTTYIKIDEIWPGGSFGAHFFDRLAVAKTGGAIFQANTDIHINSSVDFASGLIDLNSQRIYLYDNAVLNGESESSRIVDFTGGGVVVAYASLSPGSTVNPGNLGLEITPSSSTTTGPNNVMRVSRGHFSWTVNSLQGSVLRNYAVLPCTNYPYTDCFNGGNDYIAKLRFKYFDGELNGIDENQLSMWDIPHHIGRNSYDTINNYVEQTITITYSHTGTWFTLGRLPPVSPRPATSAWQQLTNSPRLPNETITNNGRPGPILPIKFFG